MKNGIYQIRNLANGARYVGSVARIGGFVDRWRRHRNLLNQGKHHSVHLQRAWNKYGSDAFVFEVLLYCSPQDCLMYEQIALDHYKPEYNICLVAGSRLGMRHTLATKIKISRAHKGLQTGDKHPMFGKHHTVQSNKQNALNHAKLTPKDVNIIRRASRVGISQKKLAARFAVSRSTIGDIQHNRCWSNF